MTGDGGTVEVWGDPDDMAVAVRPRGPGDPARELVVILQGAVAWRARLPGDDPAAAARGLAAWRAATLAEDATLTAEAPHGAGFELGRALAGFPGLSATRHGAWFMVEGPDGSAGIGLVACVRVLVGAVSGLRRWPGAGGGDAR